LLTGNALSVIVYPILAAALVAAALRRDANRPRLLCVALFTIYTVEVIKQILFPIPVDGLIAQDFATIPFWSFTNWVPLRDLLSEAVDQRQILLNVVVGIPFGFGAWFVMRQPNIVKVAGIGLAASLLAEALQAIIGSQVGFMYRVVDVNDVILNLAGILLGIGLFLVFRRLFKGVDRWIGHPDGNYWSYVRAVAS